MTDNLPAENTRRPWDRQPGEPNAAWEAFRRYRDMPSTQRNIRRLAGAIEQEREEAEESGIAPIPVGDYAALARWSREYNWVERASAWDAEVDRVWQEEQFEAVREAARRQWENSKKLQEKGIVALEYISAEQLAERFPQEVRRYITEGAEMERKLLGMDKKEESAAMGNPILVIQVVEKLEKQLRENPAIMKLTGDDIDSDTEGDVIDAEVVTDSPTD